VIAHPVSNYVIFAAGVGSRMNADLPKFLFDIDGRGVFEYQLSQLATFHGSIYIVCGYRAEAVCERVCKYVASDEGFTPQVCFVYNPDYEKSQVTSICRALRAAPLARTTFLIDGDMLFCRETIAALHSTPGTTVVVRSDVSRDAVIAYADNGQLASFRRSASTAGSTGAVEWANIAKYDPRDLARLFELSADHSIPHHFELINQLIESGSRVRLHEDAVAEIDQPEDLPAAVTFARRLR
jgi:choline kinase